MINNQHSSAQRRILVVDDDKGTSALVRIILERLGRYDVQIENHSSNVIDAAHAFRPDLILLDVVMPDKDGPEVAATLRREPALRQTPIVFLTSLITPEEEGIHGGEQYLAKPINPRSLMARVGTALDAHLAA